MSKMKNICSVYTSYSLFLYFLIKNYNDEDIFVLSGGIPESIRKNINHIYFPHFKFHFDAKETNLFSFLIKNFKIPFMQIYGILKLRILIFFKTFNCDVEVYGHGHTPYSYMFYEYENSFIIEDGLANYQKLSKTPRLNRFIEILLHIFGIYILNSKEGYGTHDNVKKVYLTKKPFPESVKDKSVYLDIKKSWDSISKVNQEKILGIFNFNQNLFTEKSIILLTQCHSEDGNLNYEEEIKIYKEIIDNYSLQNILIKPHPREKKDYSKIFPNVRKLDKDFPIELMSLFDNKISKIITINSTAALHFPIDKIEVYSGNISSEVVVQARTDLLKLINEGVE